ncbi:MAG: DUF222 domain-containing protein [Mycobacteriaceae bacterium]|nr:DUF222 domain-containing protein [Mycobacteriaceae bacterium]
MFDNLPPTPEALRRADDATVVTAIEQWNRLEAVASAHRLDAIAELTRRRSGDGERANWSCDYWDAAASEIGAALGVSRGMASSQMQIASTLRHRLPKVAALFLAGELSARIVSAISWRTYLIQDEEALQIVDAALADAATAWGPLSAYKLEQAIDLWIDRYDPGALRRTRVSARSRDVSIGAADDQTGIASLWGRLYATDAALLDHRLIQMANDVCDDDPRTIAQRRADALGALAAGTDRLACTCGDPDCPSAGDDARARSVVVNVFADESALEGQPDRHMSGEGPPSRPITPDMPLLEALTPLPEPDIPVTPRVKPPAALIMGGGVTPTPLLAELIKNGAKVHRLELPADDPEPTYQPSTRLAEFIRCRDLTCRFPGCDRPAEFCDIDHTLPYPIGPTHPSNLKCLCRKHHLLKTFWTGIDGWADTQLADGTVIWTAPNGKTYTTRPGSRLMFPKWCSSTGQPPKAPALAAPTNYRAVMMPARRRTRAAERLRRVAYERALNDACVAERNKPPPF